jgi:hypothetical protein
MDTDDKRRAAELLKDLIVERKTSPWPKVFGAAIVLGLLGGAAYWFYLPPNQKPSLGDLGNRLQAFAQSVMNTPVGSPATAPPAPPTAQKPSTPPPASDTGLLSN